MRTLTVLAVAVAAMTFAGCKKSPEARNDELSNELLSLMEKNKDDCDKLGSEMQGFMEKNKGEIAELSKWEKGLAGEEKKKYEEKEKKRNEEMGTKYAPVFQKCAQNEKFQKAMMAMAAAAAEAEGATK